MTQVDGRLVERGRALAGLSAELAAAAAGAGRVVAVTGPLGCGKTEVLARLTDLALESGARLLTAVGSRHERELGMGVVRQLCSALGEATPSRFVESVLAAAERGPVVVAVDDVQHADAESTRALTALRARSGPAPVLLVVTEWEPLPATDLTLTADRRVRLAPLTPAGIGELIASTGTVPDSALLSLCSRVTGGNPVLVRGLLADGLDEPGRGVAFGHAVLSCLHRGDERLPAVATAVAVLGGHALPALVAELSGLPRSAVVSATSALTSAGLMTAGRFAHELVREAVLGALGPAERADVHLRAARVLHGHGADAVDVARHLVASGRAGAWAVEVLRTAAAGGGAFAVRCLELALAAAGEADQAALADALAGAQWRFTAATRPDQVLSDPLVDARYSLWHKGCASGPLEVAGQWFHGPRPCEDPAGRLLSGLAAGAVADVARDAEAVLESRELGDDTVDLLAGAVLALVHADRPDQAARHCDALLDRAVAQGATTWRAVLGAARAEVALRQGWPAAARELAERSRALLPDRAWGMLLALPLGALVAAETAMGIAEAPLPVLPDGAERTVFGARYLHARGGRRLATGRVLAAVADFAESGRVAVDLGVDIPSLAPWRTGLATAYRRNGQHRMAAVLADQQLALPASASRYARGVALRALSKSRGVALLQQASAEFRAAGDRLSSALALAELSRARAAAGDAAQARRLAKAATDEARALGAVELVDRVLRDRGGVPAPAPVRGELSDAEQKVAGLAAMGHSNRDIADSLHVTVSTVEQHLTRVYRKLGVRRRGDLPTGLAE
ncbi:LuxR C-terminal-related transcriptional regulator [Actinokineospora sp. G85]|uniref:LuxR C-terminal-related transcriptional regulator n=1 Tax=Actinokineospora sp. G85 TaxID=3406626 RepID=UPI003C782F68